MDEGTIEFIRKMREIAYASYQASESIGLPYEEDRLGDYNWICERSFPALMEFFACRKVGSVNSDAEILFGELLEFVHSQLDLAAVLSDPGDDIRIRGCSYALLLSKEAIISITHRMSIHEDAEDSPDDIAKLEALERKAGQNPLHSDFAFRAAVDILRIHIQLFRPARKGESELNLVKSMKPSIKVAAR